MKSSNAIHNHPKITFMYKICNRNVQMCFILGIYWNQECFLTCQSPYQHLLLLMSTVSWVCRGGQQIHGWQCYATHMLNKTCKLYKWSMCVCVLKYFLLHFPEFKILNKILF